MKVSLAMCEEAVDRFEPDAPIWDIAQTMRDQCTDVVAIYDDDLLIGVVTERDIICRALADGRNPASVTAREVMTNAVVCAREDDELDDAVRLMEELQLHHLPVVDKNRRMVGMLRRVDPAGDPLRDSALAAPATRHAGRSSRDDG